MSDIDISREETNAAPNYLDIEGAVEAALHARIPGGSEAWVWIMRQTDAFLPSDQQRDIARCMVRAALDAAEADKRQAVMDEQGEPK